ncbi:MAG: diguanylate cyclase [Oscillospiraceae bacterium]|nr:diguanylate cyclase [Oscillospiraceae bacterium]
MNRSILADMLWDEYDIIEAEDGEKAVEVLKKYESDIDLLLLDIVMPHMDGFEVLEVMNQNHWIDEVPVIMISAETASTHVERAYGLGCTDFISRPFDALVVHRRVTNTILLYGKQKKLVGLLADQIYEKEQQNAMMIEILSNIVEFRNGESGMHVRHVRILTELLLDHLTEKTDRYNLSRNDIVLISNASALHDIGKISIPSEILNKPGRLTPEEFETMKAHTVIGGQMMDDLPDYQKEPLVQVAREICRWHHERYDGRGYPDGLKGNFIPISAQIVALADVYDALTSVRVYKPPYSHEKAIQMIMNGECGVFNPDLLDCLADIASTIPEQLRKSAGEGRIELRSVAEELHRHEELSASERTLQLLEHERMKFSFFAAMSQEIQFEYTVNPPMASLNAWGADRTDLKETIMDPKTCPEVRKIISQEAMDGLTAALRNTTPAQPIVRYECILNIKGEPRWSRIIARATWSSEEPPKYTGAIGKATDIHESRMQLEMLEREATHDPLTGLLNHAAARKQIQLRMDEHTSGHFALAILDLDYFKSANDTYGHMFGDQVLKYLASKLRENIRGEDMAARVGGDEFLIFLEYQGEAAPVIQRIFNSLTSGSYENFPISISMGVCLTDCVGKNYETVFHAADQALYAVKRSGRGNFRLYNQNMQDKLSVSAISPIDAAEAAEEDQVEKGD